MQVRGENPFDIPQELIEARKRVAKLTPDHFVYKGEEKVNPKARTLWEDIDDVYEQLEAGSKVLAGYTKELLSRIDKYEGEGELMMP